MLLTTTRLLIFAGLLFTIACSSSEQEDKVESPEQKPTLTENAKPNEKNIRTKPESQAFIKVMRVADQQAGKAIAAPGRIEFRQKAQALVGSPISGRVSAIKAHVGEQVHAGQPLLVINSFEAAKVRSELAGAKADLHLAEETAARQTLMLKRGVGLELEKLAADRQLATAKAEWERAQQAATLLGSGVSDEVIIKAPIAGTITKINTALGESVEPNQEALLEIGDTQALWAVAEVFESDLKFIQKGDLASVEVTTLPGVSLSGNVIALGAEFMDEQRRVPVYVGLKQAHSHLRSGMYARITLFPHGEDHIMLPNTAVLIKDGKRTVVYVESGQGIYQEREVQTGVSGNGKIAILDGLVPDDKVVVEGALLLDGEAEQLL